MPDNTIPYHATWEGQETLLHGTITLAIQPYWIFTKKGLIKFLIVAICRWQYVDNDDDDKHHDNGKDQDVDDDGAAQE